MPNKKWENDWKSSFKIIGFCDLPKWEVYTDGWLDVRIHFQDLHLIIPF